MYKKLIIASNTIYSQSLILLNDETISRCKIISITTMQHAISESWFGDLVTCEWWDYVWLNEGFSKYFQYFATGMV